MELGPPCLCVFHRVLAIQNKESVEMQSKKTNQGATERHRNPLHSHQSAHAALRQQKQRCSLLYGMINHSPKTPFVCVTETQIKCPKSISCVVCLNRWGVQKCSGLHLWRRWCPSLMAAVHHQRAASVHQNGADGNQSVTEVLEYFNYAGTLVAY